MIGKIIWGSSAIGAIAAFATAAFTAGGISFAAFGLALFGLFAGFVGGLFLSAIVGLITCMQSTSPASEEFAQKPKALAVETSSLTSKSSSFGNGRVFSTSPMVVPGYEAIKHTGTSQDTGPLYQLYVPLSENASVQSLDSLKEEQSSDYFSKVDSLSLDSASAMALHG